MRNGKSRTTKHALTALGMDSPYCRATCAGIFALLILTQIAGAAGTVSISDFGGRPNDGSDTTPAVRAALEQCRKTQAEKLVFGPGRYDFWPDRAEEKYLFITNNDEGLRRIAFPLIGAADLDIDGGGASFVFHGGILPFVLDHSKNITLEKFSIDWARSFHSEVKVLAVHDDGIDVSIAPQFPYKIERGSLTFLDENKKPLSLDDILEFNPAKRETAFLVFDQAAAPILRASQSAPGQVRIEEKLKATPGNILVITQAHRLYPAITLSDATDTHIADVNLYHAGGMGVVAQRSRDITLERVRVTPPPGGGRICSLTADATHFANCAGKIVMDHCLFENQMDDATNIHGIYSKITHKLSPTELEVRLIHPQQWGFDYITAGVHLELVHSDSLVTIGEATVKSAQRINKEITLVTLDSALPEELREGDVVASDDAYPDVTISHCDIGRNRARGILLGSRGKIVIEDNVFHTPGAAILLEGDGRYWFEQAGVRDLTIRHNRFENCNYGVWGNATIQVGAGIAQQCRSISRYNRNVVIEENVFRVFDPRLLNVYSMDGLTFRKNQIERSTDYPAQHADAKPFEIVDSDHVSIDDNGSSAGAAPATAPQ